MIIPNIPREHLEKVMTYLEKTTYMHVDGEFLEPCLYTIEGYEGSGPFEVRIEIGDKESNYRVMGFVDGLLSK